MVICECILSENTVNHIQNIQKILCMDFTFKNRSLVLRKMMQYVLSDFDGIPLSELILIDEYFSERPDFLREFYHEIMMSATFHSMT